VIRRRACHKRERVLCVVGAQIPVLIALGRLLYGIPITRGRQDLASALFHAPGLRVDVRVKQEPQAATHHDL
jgi:hypothetical protein